MGDRPVEGSSRGDVRGGEEGVDAFHECFCHARGEEACSEQVFFSRVRDKSDFSQDAGHAGEAEYIEGRGLHAMVYQRVMGVEVGHHGLLGRPGEFEGCFDLLRGQEIGNEIFPSHAGAVEWGSIFSGRHFQCSLIFGLSEVVDFNPFHRALGV